MIISLEIHHCPKCDSTNIIKNGCDYKKAQKYHCKDCRVYGTLKPHRPYTDDDQELILRAYRERVSMRGIKRIFGIARQTLARWLKAVAQALPDLGATLAPAWPDDVLELDELWSFVLKKSNKRWVWIALCRRTRQIVAFYIGDRDEASCRQLWQRIPDTYKPCATYSDFWEAYQKVFDTDKHQAVGKESGQTAHVERWNNTLRQRLARFVRKTLSFSKSDTFHELVLKWFIHYYNLQCIS
jgi:IS1 family transposase/transposase-like protein